MIVRLLALVLLALAWMVIVAGSLALGIALLVTGEPFRGTAFLAAAIALGVAFVRLEPRLDRWVKRARKPDPGPRVTRLFNLTFALFFALLGAWMAWMTVDGVLRGEMHVLSRIPPMAERVLSAARQPVGFWLNAALGAYFAFSCIYLAAWVPRRWRTPYLPPHE